MQVKKRICRTKAIGYFDNGKLYAEPANCGLFRLKKGGSTNIAADIPFTGMIVENYFIRIS